MSLKTEFYSLFFFAYQLSDVLQWFLIFKHCVLLFFVLFLHKNVGWRENNGKIVLHYFSFTDRFFLPPYFLVVKQSWWSGISTLTSSFLTCCHRIRKLETVTSVNSPFNNASDPCSAKNPKKRKMGFSQPCKNSSLCRHYY